MKRLLPIIIAASLLAACENKPRTHEWDWEERFAEAIKDLSRARTEEERFCYLGPAEKEALNVGKNEAALGFAKEQAKLMPKYKDNWNYGNAVQDVNIVFGRIALAEGRGKEAGEFLLKAGDTPGSPQLKSFGPNMMLAKELLERGERDVVVAYFEKCSRFWIMHRGKLEEWTRQVRNGEIPDFGANLVY